MSESTGSGGPKRLVVYAINEKDGDRGSWWQKIGTAFTNRDGSIAIYLDALPLGTNKLQVREQKDEQRAPAGANGAHAGKRTEEVRP